MNAKTLRPGLIAVRVGSRWAAVVDYTALAIEADRLPGSVGHRTGCWCSDRAGGWGTGRAPERAVQECANPVTYASIRELLVEMGAPQPTVYTVIVKDGEVVDRDLHPIAPSIRRSCGHNHRTREAAERCQQHLRNRHREATGSWIESAVWYNSQIHEHAGDSMDYLPQPHWSEWAEAEKAAIDAALAEPER